MRRWSLNAAVLAVSAVFGAPAFAGADGAVSGQPRDFMLGGIQVNEPDHTVWTKTLKSVGMNTVATTVYAKQGDWDSDNLWFEKEEPAVVAEIRTSKKAGLRVVLVLRVALDHAFSKNRFLWHGMIMPRTDEQLVEWFRRYRCFVEKWAEIAEREKVDVLAIGSEMSSMTSTEPVTEIPNLAQFYLDDEKQDKLTKELLSFESRLSRVHLRSQGAREDETLEQLLKARRKANATWARTVTYTDAIPKLMQTRLRRMNERRLRIRAAWPPIIEAARKRFSGRLTYAANFDQYSEVEFWSALDLIGINAYFQLRPHPMPGPHGKELAAKLEFGWRYHLGQLEQFRAKAKLRDKAVLFTEMGYTFRRNSTLHPWAMAGFEVVGPVDKRQLMIWSEQPSSPEERTEATRALYRTVRQMNPKLLAGILYWKLSTMVEHRIIEPFVMVVAQPALDPMQDALLRFVRSDAVVPPRANVAGP